MNTNGGVLVHSLISDLPGYGSIYYNPDGIAFVFIYSGDGDFQMFLKKKLE